MALEVNNLTKHYENLTAIKDLTFTVKQGEFCCITGPSGCGKSTLLRLIAGLEEPDNGQILLEGKCPTPKKRQIGFVFQEDTLFPWLSIRNNINFPLEIAGVERNKREQLTEHYLRLVGLERFANYYPSQLSGGMKQRVAVARALVYKPKIVLMDEPFAALDAQTRNRMQQLLIEIWKNEKITVVFVTHNIDEAIYLADKILVLSKRPSTLENTFQVPFDRPRNRTEISFVKLREKILGLIDNVAK